jgi:hypothetical protein
MSIATPKTEKEGCFAALFLLFFLQHRDPRLVIAKRLVVFFNLGEDSTMGIAVPLGEILHVLPEILDGTSQLGDT